MKKSKLTKKIIKSNRKTRSKNVQLNIKRKMTRNRKYKKQTGGNWRNSVQTYYLGGYYAKEIGDLNIKAPISNGNIYIALGEDNTIELFNNIIDGNIINSAVVTDTYINPEKPRSNRDNRLPNYLAEKKPLINGKVVGFMLPKDDKKGFILLEKEGESYFLPPPPKGFNRSQRPESGYGPSIQGSPPPSPHHNNTASWGPSPSPPPHGSNNDPLSNNN